MKRCPYASYRWIIFWLNDEGISDIPQEMHHLLEPIQGKNELEILEILVTLAQVQCSLLAISCYILPCGRNINITSNDIDAGLPNIYPLRNNTQLSKVVYDSNIITFTYTESEICDH